MNAAPPVAAGLCATCVHAKLTVTRRGTTYLRCRAAAADPTLPKYPRLPVRSCPAFTPPDARAARH